MYENTVSVDAEALADFAYDLVCRNPDGRMVSNFGGWQSEDIVNTHRMFTRHGTPIVESLIGVIEQECRDYASELQITSPLKVNSMWVNINRANDFNLLHDHYGSIISGVYYCQAPKDSGNLQFRNPFTQLINGFWGNAEFEPNPYASVGWAVEPKVNKIVMFPSWLEHMVMPSLNEEEDRISIAFNLGV